MIELSGSVGSIELAENRRGVVNILPDLRGQSGGGCKVHFRTKSFYKG
jgi:hypothetical protein